MTTRSSGTWCAGSCRWWPCPRSATTRPATPRRSPTPATSRGCPSTEEDRARTVQYQGNRAREALRGAATDLDSYLRGLEMRLLWRRFDRVGLQRVVQLINKSN